MDTNEVLVNKMLIDLKYLVDNGGDQQNINRAMYEILEYLMTSGGHVKYITGADVLNAVFTNNPKSG